METTVEFYTHRWHLRSPAWTTIIGFGKEKRPAVGPTADHRALYHSAMNYRPPKSLSEKCGMVDHLKYDGPADVLAWS